MLFLLKSFKIRIFLVLPMTYAVVWKYKKIGTECVMTNDVFFTDSARSGIECSKLCKNNPFGPCSRFIYDPEGKKCMLHSEQTITGINSVKVTTDVKWKLYGTAHNSKFWF